MRITQFGLIALGMVLAGCGTSNLPAGARLVGGGLKIEYSAPTKGTAILMERRSGRIVATESLEEGSDFNFAPNYAGCSEVIFSMFGAPNATDTSEMPQVPTNTFFNLYFVPAKTSK